MIKIRSFNCSKLLNDLIIMLFLDCPLRIQVIWWVHRLKKCVKNTRKSEYNKIKCIYYLVSKKFILSSNLNKFYRNHNSITYDHIIIRPWTNLNLTINRETLEKFLNSVLSKIIFKPGILLKTLKKDYYPAVQSMYIRELVEVCILFKHILFFFFPNHVWRFANLFWFLSLQMLEEMKCIKMIHLKNVYRPSFLSEPSPKNHNLVFCK